MNRIMNLKSAIWDQQDLLKVTQQETRKGKSVITNIKKGSGYSKIVDSIEIVNPKTKNPLLIAYNTGSNFLVFFNNLYFDNINLDMYLTNDRWVRLSI